MPPAVKATLDLISNDEFNLTYQIHISHLFLIGIMSIMITKI